jgi:hypothetical protein
VIKVSIKGWRNDALVLRGPFGGIENSTAHTRRVPIGSQRFQ